MYAFETCAICDEPRDGGPSDSPAALTRSVLGCVKWSTEDAWYWLYADLKIENVSNSIRVGPGGHNMGVLTTSQVNWKAVSQQIPGPTQNFLDELAKAKGLGFQGDFFLVGKTA